MAGVKKSKEHHQLSEEELKQIVAEADTGGRKPVGMVAKAMMLIALAWSLFQIWIASPLPFTFGIFVFNDTESRAIHLAFSVFLAFMAYPAFKRSPREYIPAVDWVLAGVGAFCAAYLFLFYAQLAERPGSPTDVDLIVAVAGMVLLLEAARRALGLPMVILAIVFITYIFAGPHMPDMIAHKGASLAKGMSHLWLTTEGVFGVALGVSSGFIFLFVLFGALLETAGAGNYFIKSAVGLLGHLRGGPAKAAVVASAATGVISGSSIANVVTTGTFTIPLMKRIGYRADKAAAVEVAGSVNGQIMPPVMGAAAFLMVEYVGIPYVQVLKHAIVPALISYIALFYIVHLEAMKANLQGIPRENPKPWQQSLTNFVMTVSGLIILAGIVYWGLGWIKAVAPGGSIVIISILMAIAYIALLKLAAHYPELHMDDPNDPIESLPDVGPTLKSGLHYLLPVVALIWNLMVEQLSPALSAFWATVFLCFILVTQRPITAYFRQQSSPGVEFRRGMQDLLDGLVTGARNMIGIGIATAAAGIIVGTVTLTGVGLVMTELVETLSGGNIVIMLFLVAFICLILGMGLPTTANYIIVSTLMAPVIVEVGAQNGLLVPLIAVHLFVFYFGLMADVTPPVGLASYAAAGIALTDPIRTGITAFTYSIRTAVLPFMFIFNTQLLLIDIEGPLHLVLTLFSATVASLIFAAATQGWFMTRCKYWESAVLMVLTFILFRPGFFMDEMFPPYQALHGNEAIEAVNNVPDNDRLRIFIEGLNIDGNEVKKGVLLPLGPKAEDAKARLAAAGVKVMALGENIQVIGVDFGSQAERLGIEQGFNITSVEIPNERPAKEWIFLPAFIVLGLIILIQRRRAKLVDPHTGVAPA
ncbi:TRAP transporter permease [Denitromonas iodatirespirans]|uniref:TRAP transporter permease n=1 Tax=Denitromonas iodatirespirans TaxID=2795389 RepID=A0A944DKE0_DENI1|nr:TRAP transporter permease [Denitromonas iodatirespirans]MBT0960379.1 TRAP transporter permease [Denitromonas iodatirespirans]